MRSGKLAAGLLLAAMVPATSLALDEAPGLPSSESTTTLSKDILRFFQISMYPTEVVGFVAFELTWSAYAEQIICNNIVETESYTVDHELEPQFKSTITLSFGAAGLQQSQRILNCYALVLQDDDEGGQPQVKILEVRDTSGNALEEPQAACVDCRVMYDNPHLDPDWADPANGYDNCGANFCGDAAETISYSTADSLIILQGSAGTRDCPAPRCDVDRNGETTAGDALRVLRRAVGLPGALLCNPPPGAECVLQTIDGD